MALSSENGIDRAGYISRLQQLAEECRQAALAPPAPAYAEDATELIQSLREEVEELRRSNAALELRLSTIEKATPTPQAWRDLMEGIRGLREMVRIATENR